MIELKAFGNYAESLRTIDAALAQLYLAGFSQGEILAILRGSGLPANAVTNPELAVSASFELQLLGHVVEKLTSTSQNVEQFVVEHFSDIPLSQFGLAGLLIASAPSLHEAAHEVLAQPELTWGHTQIRSEQVQNQVIFTFNMPSLPLQIPRHLQDSLTTYCLMRDVCAMVAILKGASNGEVHPKKIDFAFDLKNPGVVAEKLRCRIQTGLPNSMIAYSLKDLQLPPVHASPRQHWRMKQIIEKSSKFLYQEETLSRQVTHSLWSYNPPPTRKNVADLLGLSERTLTRRLANEGVTFQGLLRSVNTERAKNYLVHSKKTIADISNLMGYSETAAFSRAFTDWTGQSPSAWRTRPKMP